MNKCQKTKYLRRIIFFLYCSLLCIATYSTQAFSHGLGAEQKARSIYGNPYVSTEEVDGSIPLQNLDIYVETLKQIMPDLVISVTESSSAKGKRKNSKQKEKHYLRLVNEEDTNKAFFSLRKIHDDNIECDTSTFLLASYQQKKPIPIALLFRFLKARENIPDKTPFSFNHPYHKLCDKLESLFGKIQENEEKSLKLNKILPNVGDRAIVSVKGHIGIAKRVSQRRYELSGFNKDDGIFVDTFNISPKTFKHVDTVWKRMKVMTYTQLRYK